MKFVDDLNKEGSWKEMEGDGDLEKRINHYLTKTFILSKDVPADECLHEAQEILGMLNDGDLERRICTFLALKFSINPVGEIEKFKKIAKQVMDIIDGE